MRIDKLPFLWSVKRGDALSYLIGTFHLRNVSVEEGINPLLARTRVLYTETSENFRLEERHVTLPDQKTIEAFLMPDESKKVLQFFRQQYGRFLAPENVRTNIHKIRRKKLSQYHFRHIAQNQERQRHYNQYLKL